MSTSYRRHHEHYKKVQCWVGIILGCVLTGIVGAIGLTFAICEWLLYTLETRPWVIIMPVAAIVIWRSFA